MVMKKLDIISATESQTSALDWNFEDDFFLPGYLVFNRDGINRDRNGALLNVKDFLKISRGITASCHKLIEADLVNAKRL